MADAEDDSGSTSTTTVPGAEELPNSAEPDREGGKTEDHRAQHGVDNDPAELAPAPKQSTEPVEEVAQQPGPQPSQPGESSEAAAAEQDAELGHSFQVLSVPDQSQTIAVPDLDQNQTIAVLDSGDLLLGAGLGAEFANTTILYVQSDGSVVEGAGLTAEEQRLILEQLSKQTVVQVSDQEAAALLQGTVVQTGSQTEPETQILTETQVLTTPTTAQASALDAAQLQQVLSQVSKSQSQSQSGPVQIQVVSQSGLSGPSQQLKTVAHQVSKQIPNPAPVQTQAKPGLSQTKPGLTQTNRGLTQTNSGQNQTNSGQNQTKPGLTQTNPGLNQTKLGLTQTKQLQIQTISPKTVATKVPQPLLQKTTPVQLIQKKPEPVRIQIQVPSKVDTKAQVLTLQGGEHKSQVLTLQSVMGQQSGPIFLQQSPMEPLQLLVPMVSSKTVSSPIRVQVQTPPRPSIKIQNPALAGSALTAAKTVPKPLTQTPLVRVQTTPLKTMTMSPTSSAPNAKTRILKTTSTNPIRTAVPQPSTATAASTTVKNPTSAQPAPKALQIIRSPSKPTPGPSPGHKPDPSPDPCPYQKNPTETPVLKPKKKKKEKKAIKVQTRSGRVSRPPKYNARDYKFIKTEDLADSHQSDSDDYSDMSVEEEGHALTAAAATSGPAPSEDSDSVIWYSLKSKSFQCQSCVKAYIGAAGLNRHYRLNPTHGEPIAPDDISDKASPIYADNGQLEKPKASGDNIETQERKAESPGGDSEEEEEEEEEDEEEDDDDDDDDDDDEDSPVSRGGFHRGPGRPRGRGRGRGRARGRGRGRGYRANKGPVGVGRGRRGRPPKYGYSTTSATAEEEADRRKDKLQEMVDQCEDEDLMEIVLPRLSKVMSLWELLLSKVERGVPSRPSFPDIYREFESLQCQVRQAAQDYISLPHSPTGSPGPLEVHNIEVARCLGILDEVNRVKVTGSTSNTKNVRYLENSKMLPPSKRFKMENSVTVHQNGLESSRTDSQMLKPCSVSMTPVQLEKNVPPTEPSANEVDILLSSQEADPSDITAQMSQLEEALKSPTCSADALPTSAQASSPGPSDPIPFSRDHPTAMHTTQTPLPSTSASPDSIPRVTSTVTPKTMSPTTAATPTATGSSVATATNTSEASASMEVGSETL